MLFNPFTAVARILMCNFTILVPQQHQPALGYSRFALSFVRTQMHLFEQKLTIMPGHSTEIKHPSKIMVVGDSMSHGREGDFTWRYRLWEWLNEENLNFEFVGPCNSTFKPSESQTSSPSLLAIEQSNEASPELCKFMDNGGYADGMKFGSQHFSVWGQQTGQCAEAIRQQVATYEPDLLLVMLGFNDMGWGVRGPEDTIKVMKELLDNARSASPRLKFAVASVPQRTPMEGTKQLAKMVDTYNRYLEPSIHSWDNRDSPVRLVRIREIYDCFDGSYDGLHPNALGEFQIARAFSQTLVSHFSIGTREIVIPQKIPERPSPVPVNVTAVAQPQGITVVWDRVYGALGYDVRCRSDKTSEWELWRKDTNRHDTMGVEDGVEYQYQVRTNNGLMRGKDVLSGWSPIVSVVVRTAVILEGENSPEL
ncbi:hypothetical protein CGCSCA4_v004303 [Colletotrichum siamense]|uniref:Fibronectin type-III domain-containing protein n=1 Tax=Colletotrichum siamense TaxID=690259 RepID=A0A9P5ET70_COLSI|nr:hypothetical protein CGCSCA4_v004303 [Colletotrichum siamense]KAF4859479.1 hypothetical protein CGCSCA2_v006137 [Colletotrichum siamense]